MYLCGFCHQYWFYVLKNILNLQVIISILIILYSYFINFIFDRIKILWVGDFLPPPGIVLFGFHQL